jgi:acyl-CoA synthetase (AMP-forming)/AMP-acid ligase II
MPKAFTNGWFRTGDQGTMDADGYVSLTGRLKEIINRGGEKISAARGRRDPDGPPRRGAGGVLRMPHPKLGEEVGAAVVLREGAPPPSATAGLRRHARGRLQGAEEDPLHARDPQGRHRQAAAHRPGAKLGLCATA